MKSCTFELIVNILTYAIKNRKDAFSQKEFKNVVYTEEFNNYNINEKIAEGFEYLRKRGFLQLESTNVTYYEKYKLAQTIKIDTEYNKELPQKIILMIKSKEMINDTYEVKDDYSDIIDSVNITNSGILKKRDQEELKATLSKILISLNVESNAHYSLLTIIQLLQLKSQIKIRIKTNNCEFAASNVKFQHIQFNNDTILLSFDKCSFEIDNIENILHIDSMDSLSLKEHIEKSLTLLNSYEEKDIEFLANFLKQYSTEE